ncbi:sulfite exporter TauE/SafE family protein [Phaeobacter gallaeciensis]|uniref:Probable membrane transporter protein n=1 Tax=Phaeobacter gallaeciensis TaxID=60890 RepID=A0AAC9Z8H0_9RHOB|nr:sulfite exporter TauE/SafE family protein [Phaeobacter gallaeciensis]AHD09235.1 putative permease [Phaeobacter gallaeciensis DSM 26640]ATE92498.1 putative permease [Phaeobacter gallaeciensis]ATE97680.1 putative permease [Phaeobacter gallaeciensis]ATF01163.1 putative permease [Phaeobacter gallaeciensis]ATF05543.1 putative permease [Phaeobacter gallaeciensis]
MSALTTSLVTTAALLPEPAVLAQMAGLLIVTGAVAGVLAGLLGVGGGIVLVPAFFYVFQTLGYGGDQLMQMCLATSLATIIVTSLRSVMSHNKKGAVDWEILRGWGPGIAIGAIIGVTVASSLRSTTLQALFGVLALVIGLYMAFGRADWRLGQEMPKGARRMVLSPMVGFLSVLMGIGGGSFGVPLMSLHATPIHRAVATAAGFGVIIAVPSVIGFLFLPVEASVRPPLTVGAVNLVAFVVVIAMTLITAPWGVKQAHAMDPKPLKRVFAVFLILVALNMLRKSLGF